MCAPLQTKQHHKSRLCSAAVGSLRPYTVVLRWGVVMIMTFPQLQCQSLQSLLLVQSRHTFLDKRHHPERDGDKKKKTLQDEPPSLIDPPVNHELAAGDNQQIVGHFSVLKGSMVTSHKLKWPRKIHRIDCVLINLVHT